jgi:hydroxylamine dehydrogenase
MKITHIIMIFILNLIFLFAGSSVQAEISCVACHKEVTPGVVQQHLSGAMGQAGVTCGDCHGYDHKTKEDAKLAKMPTPQTCASCHEDQVAQFQKGKHHLSWIASSSMPMWGHQSRAIVGEGYKGCAGCHKIGAKPKELLAKFRYGNAQCDACHTRHKFSKAEGPGPACLSDLPYGV